MGKRTAAKRRLDLAMEYLRAHALEVPTLRDVAAVAGYSPTHFLRQFRKQFGQTPKETITAMQIERAKAMLVNWYSPTEIARACGFRHHQHFCSRFKQIVKKHPVRWREMMIARGECA